MIAKPPRKLHVDVPTGNGDTRRMAVHDWGEITNTNVLVCVHGLFRNGRDFDVIANALSDHYRVLCPDVIGRGESDWYANSSEYAIPNYVSAMQAMFTALAIRKYDWIGTSMGGLIGMAMTVSPSLAMAVSPSLAMAVSPSLAMAASPGLAMASPPSSGMQRFVINDIGPEIERAALERLATQLSARLATFPDYMSLFIAGQPAIASFGPLTDEQKHHLIATSCRKREDGLWEFKTDPKIGEAFVAGLTAPAVDLWPLWSGMKRRTLILRGRSSDLLSESTIDKMVALAQFSRAISVEDTGHAPMLMDDTTIAHVRKFLLSE
jgi:pimeloyl-ACP methyl ester carboxylesterase